MALPLHTLPTHCTYYIMGIQSGREPDLVEKIDRFVQTSNANAQPFVWTASADSIFANYANEFPGLDTS